MRNRRLLTLPFAAMAVVLATAAAAYACTAFVGWFEVTGNATGSGTVHVEGTDTLDSFNMTQDPDTGVASVPLTGGAVTIKTGIALNGSAIPDTYNGRNYNPYNVLYYNNTKTNLNGSTRYGYKGSASDDSRVWSTDCMNDDTTSLDVLDGNGTKIGEATIGAMGSADEGEIVGVPTGQGTYNGNNTATYALPDLTKTNSPGTNESALCISDDAYYYGNQAPFTVL